MPNARKPYFAYWGKAGNGSYHLLPYHSLDVSAVACVFLEQNPSMLNKFSQLTGLSVVEFKQWFPFFMALHDVGKFAESFQNLKPDILECLQNKKSNLRYGLRHDTLGKVFWDECLKQQFQDYGLIKAVEGSSRWQAIAENPVDLWINAVVGHHGEPPQSDSDRLFRDDWTDNNKTAILEFLKDIIPIFIPDQPVFPSVDLEKTKKASWWLAGLAVLSDWLGSNTEFFEYETQEMPLKVYYEKAKEKAKTAISKTNILKAQVCSSLKWSDLLNKKARPSPLQSKISQWPILENSPHLFILEDITGSGKTEASLFLAHKLMKAGPKIMSSKCRLASLFLAHKLMKAGQGQGIYFALPTMATSNAMYIRLKKLAPYLFKPKTASLILAHGARDFFKEFQDSIMSEPPLAESGYGDQAKPAGSHCISWLADNRKKALLADIGVGTIDQALLSVLPSRHQSLRLLGLLNKVLLVDEVHSCDPYMNKLLCNLLKAHAWSGGSAILLSATLSLKQRQEFINCYTESQNWGNYKVQDKTSFPLISCLNRDGLKEQAVEQKRD